MTEINLTISANDVATPQINQVSSPNSTAFGLEAKIDKLVDVMTQFIDLQLQEATQPLTHQPTRTKVKAITQAKPITALNTPENDKADDSTSQRSSRNSPSAEATINKAINAIIAHNNATELHT